MQRKGKSNNGKKRNINSTTVRRNDTITRTIAPVAVGLSRKNGIPRMVTSPNGTSTISHTEYFGELKSDPSTVGAFFVTSRPINPGSSVMFPWLSTIAPSYESYRFKSLSFLYEPSVATSMAGVIQLAVDYDVKDAAPSSKLELMSNAHAVRSSPYTFAKYTLDQKDAGTLGTRRYVRTGAVPSGTDPKTYDVGSFLAATSGFAATDTTSGELYVSYVVELITPQLDSSGRAASVSAKVAGTVGVDKTHIFGTTAATITGDLPVSAITNTITFSVSGEYLLNFYTTGTVLGGANFTPTLSLGATSTNIANTIDAAATGNTQTQIVKVLQPNTTALYDLSGATTVSALTVRISRYAYANA